MCKIRAQSRLKAVFSNRGLAAVPPLYPAFPRVCFSSFSSSIDLFFFTQLPSVASIAQRYRINKYPTLKLFRNGMMMKREYRGQRSVVAIADFIRQQQVDPVKELHSVEETNAVDVRGRRCVPRTDGLCQMKGLSFFVLGPTEE